MKILKSSGCTAFYTLIDGVDISHSPIPEELKMYITDELSRFISLLDNNDLLSLCEILAENYGECYSDDIQCEQCGDTVYQYTLDTDDFIKDK